MKSDLVFCLALCSLGCGGQTLSFWAGAAQTDITPQFEPYQDVNGNLRYDAGEPFQDLDGDGVLDTLWLGGFGPRQPTGVHDRLSARTLMLKLGNQILSLTAVDALGLSLGRIEKIKESVVRRLGDEAPPPESMIIASTHTHQAPDTIGIFGPGSLQPGWDAAYLDLVVERVAESIEKAWKNLRPAQLLVAETDAPDAVADIIPPEVMDTRLILLQARDENGEVMATVVSAANHPEAAWNKNTEVSADYPDKLRQLLEERYGGLALFFSGAIGLMQTPAAMGEEGFERVEKIAQYYSEKAAEAFERPEQLDAVWKFEWRKIPLPLENFELYAAVQADAAEGYREFLYQSDEPPCKGSLGCLDLPVLALRLGQNFTLVTVPGEMTPELLLGGILRPPDSKGPFPDAPPEPVLKDCISTERFMLLGLAGAEIGYIYPKMEYDPESYYSYLHSAGPSVAMIINENLCQMLRAIEQGD